MKLLKKTTLIAAALMASCLSANAVLIASFDFDSIADGNPDGYLFAFSYGGSGNPTFTYGVASGVGVGGSKGAQITTDFTGQASFWGTGFGRTDFSPLAPASSTNLADYTFSITYKTVGATGNGVAFIAKFENQNDALDVEYKRSAFAQTNGEFVTITTTLADAGWNLSSGDDAANIPASTGFTFIALQEPGGAWGADAGNQLIVDNVSFSIVPEPSTYAALAGAALLGLAYLRRRK